MLTFRKGLGDTTATTRAILSRAVRVNRHIQSTSLRGFVLQHMQELRPSGVSHALAHVAATQPLDVQILDDDREGHGEVARQENVAGEAHALAVDAQDVLGARDGAVLGLDRVTDLALFGQGMRSS